MYRFGLSLVCVLGLYMDCFGQGCAGSAATTSCSGARSLRTPVRDLIAARPIRTGILARISSVRSASCGQAALSCGQSAASCAGSLAAPSCAGSTVIPSAPAPTAASCNCGCEQGLPCTCHSQKQVQVSYVAPVMDCPTGTCNLVESQQHFATPVRTAMSNAYAQALASAQYRAANRIHGHSYLDTHRTSGVGWATSNSKPNTCLGGDNGSTYAVVQGADGWYATKFN